MRNVPDDWDCYYTKCDNCGAKYHMSEGGCECQVPDGPCPECDGVLDSDDMQIYCTKCGFSEEIVSGPTEPDYEPDEDPGEYEFHDIYG